MNGGATKVLQGSERVKSHESYIYNASAKKWNGYYISVQAMVGHRELSITQRYIRLDATDLQGATGALEIDLED